MKKSYKKLIKYLSKLNESIFVFLKEHKSGMKYIAQFTFIIFFYGFMINFVLNQLLGNKMNLSMIIAWGFIAYIVKIEMPPIISSSLPKPPMTGMAIPMQ